MICGDSLAVMASLAERERLKGRVQCIYFDPPYGIRFNQNWQVSTASAEVTSKQSDISREPEQVQAFRDTWKDSIHSYLTYLRDRLTVARDLLTDNGSIFVQIGDDNVHSVRSLMDEVFRPKNFVAMITVLKTSAQTSEFLSMSTDYVLFYAKDKERLKYRRLMTDKTPTDSMINEYAYYEDDLLWRGNLPHADGPNEWLELEKKLKIFTKDQTTSNRPPGSFPVMFRGRQYTPRRGYWKTGPSGLDRLIKSNRIEPRGSSLRYVRFYRDYSVSPRGLCLCFR
jgi:adenine-specific DNA-methyltransferase